MGELLIPIFTPIKVADQTLMLIQRAIANVLSVLSSVRLLSGVLQVVTFPSAAADVTIYHNLGVPNVTFLEGDKSVPGFVYRSSTVPQFPNRAVVLRASAPMTATIWFFPQ